MKYFIGLLLTIAVILFVIIRLLVGSGPAEPQKKAVSLASYATTDTTVRFTINNPVQAAVDHRVMQITVGRDVAEFALYKGYDQDLITSKTYAMEDGAYVDFLRALELSGDFTKGNDDAKLQDERGYCALGSQFIYEVIGGDGDVKQHYWSTTCGDKTFGGKSGIVHSLFKAQIPDYTDLVRGERL